MIFDPDTFTGIINKIVNYNLKFLVPREGQVKDLKDPLKKGRVLVVIPALGWDTNDKGAWCSTVDKNLLSTVKIDDWLIIQFVDGDSTTPICIGKSTRIKDQLPKNYDGEPTTHILFESPEDKIMLKYDEKKDLLQIGKTDFKSSARVDDTTTSSSSEDSAFWTFFSAFFAVITGSPIPEPGLGAPSALQAAMTAAITAAGGTQSKMDGKITSGSSQVEVGDK